MYNPEIAITFDHSKLGVENKFFPSKNNLFAHLHHHYFIRVTGQSQNILLCYKAGR